MRLKLHYIFITNKSNTLNIIANSSKVYINTNITNIYNNLNIYNNSNINSLYVNKNLNLTNDIIFNKKVIFKNNQNKLETYVASNYNKDDFDFYNVSETLDK